MEREARPGLCIREHQLRVPVAILADEQTLQRFSRYARSGIRTFGEDPKIVRIQFGNGETT